MPLKGGNQPLFNPQHPAWPALKAAFPHTIPILAGFGFLGLTYGIYVRVQGFSFWYAALTGIIIFGGSLQFVVIDMLRAPFAPIQTFLAALLIQARHLFYGLAMLDKFRGTGRKKLYLIYAMCDESFSINCSAKIPDGIDHGWFMFWVSLLDQSYWVIASAVGGVLGGLIDFNTEGLDFVMTAMFVVIFLEQCLKENQPITPAIGLVVPGVCLALFGPDQFLIPGMVAILALLVALRNPIEKAGEKKR